MQYILPPHGSVTYVEYQKRLFGWGPIQLRKRVVHDWEQSLACKHVVQRVDFSDAPIRVRLHEPNFQSSDDAHFALSIELAVQPNFAEPDRLKECVPAFCAAPR